MLQTEVGLPSTWTAGRTGGGIGWRLENDFVLIQRLWLRAR
jgi:hypothetical protein